MSRYIAVLFAMALSASCSGDDNLVNPADPPRAPSPPGEGVGVSSPTPNPNQAPVARPDTFHVPPGGTLVVVAPGILANDSDEDGDPLVALLETAPAHGAISGSDIDGGFTYTPEPGFVGTDEFTYRAVEDIGSGSRESAPAKVVIVVEEPRL